MERLKGMKKLFVFCASLMMAFNAYAQCQIEVFDSMLFIGKPDMTQYGLTPIKLISSSKLFPIGTDKSLVPADETVINALTGVHDLAAINIEHCCQQIELSGFVTHKLSAF